MSTSSLQEFIQSFSSTESADYSNEVDLDPFLTAILDLSGIECDSQSLQSLAFIAGYSVHQYLKKCDRLCRICDDALTVEKRLVVDDLSDSQFKLLLLSDRGSLKYPSEIVLESIVDVWKIVIKIENSNDLMAMLVEGPSRKIIFDLSMNHILENEGDFWSKVCSSCGSRSRDILRKLIFVAVNCYLANTVKNYNSQLIGIEKRKFKKFKN